MKNTKSALYRICIWVTVTYRLMYIDVDEFSTINLTHTDKRREKQGWMAECGTLFTVGYKRQSDITPMLPFPELVPGRKDRKSMHEYE